ncbi:thymus-specific serine protease-like [Chironomus tepperi]|uniref:thymus-specific serine protease-like n=1 Tax=Chironomus tepperi TaxID=113505 RepID=UPI00391F3BE0
MKAFLVLFGVIATVQLSFAIFGEFEYGDKNSKYFKKEPPLRATKPLAAVDNVYEGWIKQRMDNFDPQNTESFYMRYLFNFENFQPGGPIFIFVGGEWTVSPGTLQYGHMYDMAKALNGLLIYTEHRYYGATTPTPDLTLENLRYLNIDQALADLAHFIVSIKKTFPGAEDSGVILVGCSYSATMVTWFMQKYPHLIKGAWALSGPLLAQVDFVEYYEVVSRAIHEVGGSNCSGIIRSAFEQMEALVEQGNAAELQRHFKLCKPLDLSNNLDVWSLFGDAAGTWAGLVQYYYRYDRDIENACEGLEAKYVNATSELDAYASWLMDRWRIGNNCYEHTYEAFLDRWSGTSWDDWIAQSEWRQWYYQTCAEYGWYQSSGSKEILFGNNFPVNISVQICSDLYKGFFTPTSIQGNVDRTNVIYGAKNPSVQNVYSTHGEYDPWAPMGLDDDASDPMVVYLPTESHCSDMSSIHSRDTVEMIASKNKIFELVQKWLGIPQQDWITLPPVA